MTCYTHIDLETAACLWEAVLHLRDMTVTDPDTIARAMAIRKSCDELGTATLRLIVVGWTSAVEAAWRKADDTDLSSFDWDFVPQWICDTIDWSDPRNPIVHHGISGIAKTPCSSIPQPGDPAIQVPTDRGSRPRAATDLHAAAILHRHGANIHAAIDEATLDAELAAWCRTWWQEIRDDRDPLSLDDEEVIRAYFEQHSSDSLVKDRAQVTFPLLPTDEPEPSLEEGRYCVLSTAHLTVHTANLLDKWATWPPTDRPIDIAASTYGWFVPARPLDDDRRRQIPGDLLRLIDFGRDRVFQFLLFDCDGERADELPVHDW